MILDFSTVTEFIPHTTTRKEVKPLQIDTSEKSDHPSQERSDKDSEKKLDESASKSDKDLSRGKRGKAARKTRPVLKGAHLS
jgi:hypothetical protein